MGVRGREAWAAYETLRSGNRLPTVDGLEGVSIWIRELAAGERPLVCVFREGMWITSSARHLESRNFANLVPFCAVINVDDPSSGTDEKTVCSLVREAEGETHSQIRVSEITNPQKREQLRIALKTIADVLRSHSKPAEGRTVEPDQLRMFHGTKLTPAPAPPLRRRTPEEEDPPPTDEPDTDVADIDVTGDDGGGGGGGGKGGGGGGGDRSGDRAAPRRISARGNSSGIRSSSRHTGGRRWAVVWRAQKVPPGGFRVLAVLPSGTDETTERQIVDRLLAIKTLQILNRVHKPTSDSGGLEVLVGEPRQAGEAELELAEDLAPQDAALVRIRVMHGRAPRP